MIEGLFSDRLMVAIAPIEMSTVSANPHLRIAKDRYSLREGNPLAGDSCFSDTVTSFLIGLGSGLQIRKQVSDSERIDGRRYGWCCENRAAVAVFNQLLTDCAWLRRVK